jgi:hypothetical protein
MIAAFAPIVLALLPLDLQPPEAAPAAPRDLEVRLEIEPVDGGTARYRIVHTFRGEKPMRFVTGATDRSCEQPVDVLVAGGSIVPLDAQLPCGGAAFTTVQRIAPGGSWTIAGFTSLPKGVDRIAARYCPAKDDLRGIAPEERLLKSSPIWKGCVDSPAVRPAPILASTPERAWALLLESMRANDERSVRRLTSERGVQSLRAGVSGGETPREAFARLGRAWAGWELRVGKVAGDRAEARLGPRVKEHSLEFVRVGGEWRLDRWTPGE